jgi:GT2 family glycosyltransferase
VVLSYNHPELTARTLQSVLKVTSSHLITLVHNGSEAPHVQKLRTQFPQVEHLVFKSNRGYSGGANRGLAHVFQKKLWALFLTNDCELQTLPVSLPEQPGLFAPKIEIRKTGRTDSLGGLFHIQSARLEHCKVESEFTLRRKDVLPYAPGTAYLIHRYVFLDSGGFDERLGTYWEDVDFSVRVQQRGWPLSLISEIKIHHGIGKTCHKHREYTLYLYQRNRKTVGLRYVPSYRRPLLQVQLVGSWLRIASRLIRQRRTRDLRLLWKAALHG